MPMFRSGHPAIGGGTVRQLRPRPRHKLTPGGTLKKNPLTHEDTMRKTFHAALLAALLGAGAANAQAPSRSA
jgi:hypothetical protein